MWLAELAGAPDVSEVLAGGLGSSVLLAAALSCAYRIPYMTPSIARMVVPFAFAVLAVNAHIAVVVLMVACLVLGGALGVLSRDALARVSTGNVLQGVSTAFASGLCASLLVYLILPVIKLPSLLVLAALSLTLFAIPLDKIETKEVRGSKFSQLPIGYLPFFALMGAYWSFIEIYARSINDNSGVAGWLLGSLIASAVASALAGKLHPRRWKRTAALALGGAALTGAASFLTTTPLLLGMSVLANGFFLFLFFPLYLSSQGERAQQAMALYLLGFACGGVCGAGILSIGGYPTLAVAILLSPLAVFATPPSRAAS